MMNKRFTIPFNDGRTALAVYVPRYFNPALVAQVLGLPMPRPTIYITGGAGLMSPEDIQVTRMVVEQGLARFAEEHQAIVIDGGTQAGIPAMLGEARLKHRYRFPLVGVVPLELVNYPGHISSHPESAELNSGHSHFVLTAGDAFGDESEPIAQFTYTLSGQGLMPALGVLINGGSIARQEVYQRTTSDSMSFPLVVVEGSGRFADVLAQAFHAGHAEDADLQAIIQTGRLALVSIKDGPEQMYNRLSALFHAFHPRPNTPAGQV